MAYTTIKKPTDYFFTKLYSGSNGTQSVTGVGFQPDFSWLKCRSTGYNHRLFDAVRGAGKNLQSNDTTAEQTVDEGITAFNSDGFSVKQGSNLEYNASGETYVAWNWKANGAGSANTDGQITSTVSVNTTAGFSIVKFDLTSEGSATKTVGHGLGVAPKMIITKPLGAIGWHTWHTSLGTDYVVLNTTAAKASSGNFLNSEAPTASTFKIGDTSNGTFWNNNDCIAYCFAEKTGFSKCNKYIGNGSTDGTFVYTGFKPAFVLIKLSSATADWQIFDNKREGYNDANDALYPNLTNVEGSTARIQLLSNGFKLIDNNNWGWNKSGETYIYYAVAEEPLVGDNPATAR